jgi:methionyl-tRNA formyltransferase
VELSAKSEFQIPKSKIRIVFMGTSTFAVPSLVKLFEEGFSIVGVITQADKPSGRGQAIQSPPVKKKAFEIHLPVYQPRTLKDDGARALFDALAPDMLVVVAYGKILPAWLLQLPKCGAINVHGSLLPKYRGAAPIQWAIANGEQETGVSTMQIDEGLDTGPVFLREKTLVGPDETVQELSERLAKTGASLLIRTIEGVLDGTLKPAPQDDSLATTAPILEKSHGIVNWKDPAKRIHDRVRAFTPWPGAAARFRQTACKILKTRVGGAAPEELEPGTILASKRSFAVVCGDSRLLEIVELQPENRKPVQGFEFANGTRIQPGEKFERLADN